MSEIADTKYAPLGEAAGIAFRLLRAALFVAAVIWATGNTRPAPPGSQVVVLRFGAVARVQQAGLVLAWPRPLEQVVLLPSAERRMVQAVGGSQDAPALLTGDNGMVLLDAAVTWHVSDAAAFYVMQAHVAPALQRLFFEAATHIAARHALDDFLAVRAERANDPRGQAARAAIRGDIVDSINAGLTALAASDAALGIEILRADITPMLPPQTKSAFDAVLEAAQRADQGLAGARTDAAHILQQANRDRDRIIADAHAAAAERVARARSSTATIFALEAQANYSTRPALLADLYRDRIAAVLRQAGSVSTVDPKSVSKLILPGVNY